jgi:ribosome-associated protein
MPLGAAPAMTRRAAPHRGIDAHYGDAADDDARPSKTRLKQQSHDLQDLGMALAALSEDRLAASTCPTRCATRSTVPPHRSHEGRRRQMQYIGKLMRSADEALAARSGGRSHAGHRARDAAAARDRDAGAPS